MSAHNGMPVNITNYHVARKRSIPNLHLSATILCANATYKYVVPRAIKDNMVLNILFSKRYTTQYKRDVYYKIT